MIPEYVSQVQDQLLSSTFHKPLSSSFFFKLFR